jgi:hypothetical protein
VADWSCFGSVMRFTLKPSCLQALTREWTFPNVSSIQTSPLLPSGMLSAIVRGGLEVYQMRLNRGGSGNFKNVHNFDE